MRKILVISNFYLALLQMPPSPTPPPPAMMFEVDVENVIEDQWNSSGFHLDGPPVLTFVEG